MLIRIDDIEIGERFRKDLGDIGDLAQSIAGIGLLHPIVVTPDMRLIAGQRRIAACQSLGLTEIEATVLDIDNIVKGEFAENEQRKDFTWSERVEISKAIEPVEREAARERMQSHTETGYVKFTDPAPALDKVASFVGTSRPTLVKAREIYDSGDEDLIQEMDRTGKIDGVYRKLQMQHRDIPEPPAIPDGKYSVIYADPPWCYGDKLIEGYGAAEHHYPAMTIDELCELPICDLAADNAVLFLWVTSPMLAECFRVIDAWGFTYKASFVWDKVKHNYGHYNSVRHEFLLICTRGSCLPENGVLYDSVMSLERSERHSEKPEHFRLLIEAMYPGGKKIELFARTRPPGWDVWGNEA